MMGSGIAQVCAQAGFPTVVREVNAELVDKGLKGIEKNQGHPPWEFVIPGCFHGFAGLRRPIQLN